VVSFFDPTQENEIKRRRKMAEILQAQSAPKATEVISGYAVPQSGLQGISNGLGNVLAAYAGGTADEKENELTKNRQALMAQAIEKLGTDPKGAAGILLQDPSLMKEGFGLYGDALKVDAENAAFEKEADLKRELIKLRSGSTEPYVDPDTGEIVNPLPKLSATEQKSFDEQQGNITNAKSSLDAFQQIKEYQGKPMFSGSGAETIAAANRIPIVGDLINDEKASNTTAYQNLVKTGQFKQLKATFPGAISNGERTALENLGALASYTPQEQQQIVADAESGIKKLLAKSEERASDIASGNQYRKAVGGTKQKEGTLAPDGNYYIPDPARPGKYLKVK